MDAYPLQWPAGWPRTSRPMRARFGTPFRRAQSELFNELRLLGATSIVISSNLQLRRDGLPYASQKQPDDIGVAVYFVLNGEQQCIPCDKWDHYQDNLQAIRLTIQALRGLDRWGAKEMVNAAFRGFKALPAEAIMTPYTARAWWEVLEISQDASDVVIRAAYKAKLHEVHPDKGGSQAAFEELQKAYREASNE